MVLSAVRPGYLGLSGPLGRCICFVSDIGHSPWHHLFHLLHPHSCWKRTGTPVPPPTLTLSKSHPGAVGDASHPRFPLGLHRVHQAFPWRLVAWTLSCPFIPCPPWHIHFSEPLIPSSSTCLGSSGFSLSCHVGQAFSRIPRPIKVVDQQHLPGLAKSCDPNCKFCFLQLWVLCGPYEQSRHNVVWFLRLLSL
mgnify:CR=1 FL=1